MCVATSLDQVIIFMLRAKNSNIQYHKVDKQMLKEDGEASSITESEIENINVQKVVVEIPYSGYILRVYKLLQKDRFKGFRGLNVC